MRVRAFSLRNAKEMLRDPLNMFFGLAFPILILILFSAINAHVPQGIFSIQKMAPGVAVFGLSFISLFSGTLISKDRASSFLMRLYASPLSASDFILGYTLPLLPMAILQIIICFIAAFFFKLPANINVLIAIVVLIPTILFFIAVGLLCGTLLNDKQVGGICGALLTNCSALLGGAWFDLKLIGGTFEKICYLLPFAHAVDTAKSAISGDYSSIFPHLWWVIGYALIFFVLAVWAFKKKMKA